MLKKELHSLSIVFFLFIFCLWGSSINAQTALFSGTPVSDSGTNNNIGSANTSRNIAADSNGNIYVVYANSTEVRLAKSTDGGQSFLPSILIANANGVEPELAVNDAGIVFVAWNENGTVSLSSSTDGGTTFNSPVIVGVFVPGDIHMSTFGSNVYLTNQSGESFFSNSNNGVGAFSEIATGTSMVYADVLTDQNGVVYLPMDNPNLRLFESTTQGASLTETTLTPPGQVFFSSYALSDGPCGTFIFVGGGANPPSETLGYRIDVTTGSLTEITLGRNAMIAEGRTLYADNKGTLIDGYSNDDGDLVISVSSDQGNTFNTPIVVASGGSHNIARSPTTENILVVYESGGEIFVSVYNDLLKNIEIAEPNPPLSFCSSETFDLSFTLTGVFSPGTTFTASLSDEFGNFANAIEIGSVDTDSSGIITCTIPGNLTTSDLYRIQIESLDNCIQSNSITMSIAQAEISGPDNVCIGESIQLTGTATPDPLNPWTSSDTNVATVDNTGMVTSVNPGSTVITYATNNGCTDTYTIQVNDLPVVNPNVSLQQCDDDTDGFSNFNLTEVNALIVNNPSDYTITYYETMTQAEDNDSPIANFLTYPNQVASSDTIWARVENSNGCFRTSEIELIVSTTQIPSNFLRIFNECDDGANTADGIASFNLSSVDGDIRNLFPPNQQLVIRYYQSETDALAEINPITDTTNYQNTTSPDQQNIYVRVDSQVNNECLGLGHHITLNVERVPVANPVTIDAECDNDRDGLVSFDTSTIENIIVGSQTNVSVSYFDENGVSLPSPLPNPFATASQTVTARITSDISIDPDGQCYDETTIDFVVHVVPIANPVSPQETCDNDFDGIVGFDTSAIESSVLMGQTGMTVRYFDQNNNELPSPLPNPFNSESQTIRVLVENPISTICSDETFIQLVVREKPDFDLLQEDIICITDSPSLNLSIENPRGNYNYFWENENGVNIGDNPSITVTSGGVYSVYAESIHGCQSFVKSITVNESSIANLSIKNLTVVDDSTNNSITINIEGLGLGDYEFSLTDEDDNIIINYQDEPFFDNLQGGIYNVLVRDKDGCGTASLEVPIVEFPLFFTPNDDGINDIWSIRGIRKTYREGKVTFFDRYGKVVNVSSINSVGWNGFFNNGKKAPSSTYWFHAELVGNDNSLRVKKGKIALLRNKQ